MPVGRADEDRLVADRIELTRPYGRYGERRIAALLRDAGWRVNDKRVERLWLNDGACVRLRPAYRNPVGCYDFVHPRTDDGKAFRTLNILDEFSRECLAIRVQRKLNSTAVIDALTDLFTLRGVPTYIRSDNDPEFVAQAVRDWIKSVGARTAYIEPGSPWENGYCESFNARCRDELLNGAVFYALREAQMIIESWRTHDNTKRPHSALGYRPPAPETIVTMETRAAHALTFKLDHPGGADQEKNFRVYTVPTKSGCSSIVKGSRSHGGAIFALWSRPSSVYSRRK